MQRLTKLNKVLFIAAVILILNFALAVGISNTALADDDTHYAKIHFTTHYCDQGFLFFGGGCHNSAAAGDDLQEGDAKITHLHVHGYNQNGDLVDWDSSWAWGNDQSSRTDTVTENWWWAQWRGIDLDFTLVHANGELFQPNDGQRSCYVLNYDQSIYSMRVFYQGNGVCTSAEE